MLTQRAEKIIKNHVLLSLGLSALPVPMLDFLLVQYVQMDMIKQLSDEYHKDFHEMQGKAFVSALASMSLARVGASLIKTVPGFGSLIGGASSIVLSGASTYALGKVTVRFFNENLELSDIDMDLAKSFFKEEFEIGKTYAADLAKKAKEKRSGQYDEEKEVYQKLIKLKKLRDENLISEKEYESKRAKLMAKLDLED